MGSCIGGGEGSEGIRKAKFNLLVGIGSHGIQMHGTRETAAGVFTGPKKNGPKGPVKVLAGFTDSKSYLGDVLLPLGEADGGHGVPGVGLIPLFACVLPLEVEGVVLDVPGVELEVLGVELDDALAEPGKVPHGEPLGLVGVAVWLVPFGFVGVVPGVVVLGVVVLGVPAGGMEPGVVWL